MIISDQLCSSLILRLHLSVSPFSVFFLTVCCKYYLVSLLLPSPYCSCSAYINSGEIKFVYNAAILCFLDLKHQEDRGLEFDAVAPRGAGHPLSPCGLVPSLPRLLLFFYFSLSRWL